MSKKTLVIGASSNPQRYSYLAIQKLRKYGHEVIALSRKSGHVGDVEFKTKYEFFDDIDSVTLYIGTNNQEGLFKYLTTLAPKRVIFNPGTENISLLQQLSKHNIECINACTLVMLSVDQY